MSYSGIRGIALRSDGIVPLAFEIQRNDGLDFCIAPPPEIIDQKDAELQNQLLALWASRMTREMGIPARFWVEGDNLLFEPKDKKWVLVEME